MIACQCGRLTNLPTKETVRLVRAMPEELDFNVRRLFVQGDREAFEALFKQFEIEVYLWVVRIVRDTGAAEDVVVEAFWRAYRGRVRSVRHGIDRVVDPDANRL